MPYVRGEPDPPGNCEFCVPDRWGDMTYVGLLSFTDTEAIFPGGCTKCGRKWESRQPREEWIDEVLGQGRVSVETAIPIMWPNWTPPWSRT